MVWRGRVIGLSPLGRGTPVGPSPSDEHAGGVLGVSSAMLGELESIKSSSNTLINACLKLSLTMMNSKKDAADEIKTWDNVCT